VAAAEVVVGERVREDQAPAGERAKSPNEGHGVFAALRAVDADHDLLTWVIPPVWASTRRCEVGQHGHPVRVRAGVRADYLPGSERRRGCVFLRVRYARNPRCERTLHCGCLMHQSDLPDRRRCIGMTSIKDATSEFLAHRRVAVTGVSRDPQSHGGNIVYKRLRDRGYEVFAVNPNADEVEGTARITTCARSPAASRPS
jgi:hypothetical protein